MPKDPSFVPIATGIAACAALLVTLALTAPTNPLLARLASQEPQEGSLHPAAARHVPGPNIEVGISKDVRAHQGVASVDGTTSDFWIFDTRSIKRFNWSWELVAENDAPFGAGGAPGLLPGFSDMECHLGAGAAYDGKLYVPAENWPSATNPQILVYDAQTLGLLRAVPTGQTHEVAAVAVVPEEGEHGILYVASYQDSSRLFKYDLDTLAYVGDLPMSPALPVGIQGLAYYYGMLFVASSDGVRNVGHLYSVKRDSGETKLLYTSTEHGTHEGIVWRDGKLLWLIDRHLKGSRVHYLDVHALLGDQ